MRRNLEIENQRKSFRGGQRTVGIPMVKEKINLAGRVQQNVWTSHLCSSTSIIKFNCKVHNSS